MATEASAIPSISSLITSKSAPASAATPAASASNSSSSLTSTDFLSLLTAQLSHQDPLNPVDDTQSVAELAQFSSLQATNTLSTQFTNFESSFSMGQAAGLLGANVTVSSTDAAGNPSTVAGTVKSIQMVNGSPQFEMTNSSGAVINGSNGSPLQFSASQILGIQ